MFNEPVSHSGLRNARRDVRERRAEYIATRRAALAAPKWVVRYPTVRGVPLYGPYRCANLEREELVCTALERRDWLTRAVAYLARLEARPLLKGGSSVSPAARERAIATGRWKREEEQQ